MFQAFINPSGNLKVLNASAGDKSWRKGQLLVLGHKFASAALQAIILDMICISCHQ